MAGSVAEIFKEIPSRFDSDAWGSEDAVLVFDISGDDGGQWTAHIKDGQLSIEDGAVEDADMTMYTASEDMVAMVNGDLNPVSAFMGGKVRVDGNMALAMKLQSLLGL